MFVSLHAFLFYIYYCKLFDRFSFLFHTKGFVVIKASFFFLFFFITTLLTVFEKKSRFKSRASRAQCKLYKYLWNDLEKFILKERDPKHNAVIEKKKTNDEHWRTEMPAELSCTSEGSCNLKGVCMMKYSLHFGNTGLRCYAFKNDPET